MKSCRFLQDSGKYQGLFGLAMGILALDIKLSLIFFQIKQKPAQLQNFNNCWKKHFECCRLQSIFKNLMLCMVS